MIVLQISVLCNLSHKLWDNLVAKRHNEFMPQAVAQSDQRQIIEKNRSRFSASVESVVYSLSDTNTKAPSELTNEALLSVLY